MTNYTKTILQLKDKNIIFNNDSVKECVIKNVNSLVFATTCENKAIRTTRAKRFSHIKK